MIQTHSGTPADRYELRLELSEEQIYALSGFGFRPGLMADDELGRAVDDVIAWARAELERRTTHGNRPSDMPAPAYVLEAFGKQFSPSPKDVLQALTDRSLGRLTINEAQTRLGEEVARARRELGRVGALAKGATGGDTFLQRSLPATRTWIRPGLRSVRLEPAKGLERNRRGFWLWEPPPGWENEGPWGGSLAWLEQQSRPDPEDRCERCNWPGRYPDLVGVDDGNRPRRILEKAERGSIGSRKPLLDRYKVGDDSFRAIDHMQGAGDRRCAVCGGRGRIAPDSWESDPRLRRRAVGHLAADDQVVGQLLEAFDEGGRLRPLWDRDVQSHVAQDSEPTLGGDAEVGSWGEDERALVLQIATAAAAYQARGRTQVEGAIVDAHKRDYEETPAVLEPLELRQFLADATFAGSGNTDPERRWAFHRRDAVIFELVALGFPLSRISEVVGVSEKRLYNLRVVRAARKAFETNQRGLAVHWHERGFTTSQIARASGLSLKTVQRIVKKGSPPASERSFAETPLMELLQVAFTYRPVLEEMQLFPERSAPPERPLTPEEAGAGIPIDYFERVPPGMPLAFESETYHSYVPGEQERLGAPPGDPRSPGVLHPFLHALLGRSRYRRFAVAA